MSNSDFEAIVDGQFAPHLGQWCELDLHSTYEHIEPNSAVGRIAVELAQAQVDSVENYSNCRWDYSNRTVGADEVNTAMHERDRAEARYKVLAGMYYDVLSNQRIGRMSYQAAVSGALKRGVRELGSIWIPPGTKPELLTLNGLYPLF